MGADVTALSLAIISVGLLIPQGRFDANPPTGWRCSRRAGHDGPCAATFSVDALTMDLRGCPRGSAVDRALEERALNPVCATNPAPDTKFEPAEQLYLEAGGPGLTAAANKLSNALKKQGARMEQYDNTPYTEDQARVMRATMETLSATLDELERWHELVFPWKPKRKEKLYDVDRDHH